MRKKVHIILFLAGLLVGGSAVAIGATHPYTVVIDAGHGGKDPGAIGKISQEKNLNLAVALETGRLLNAQYPDVKVVYTRKTDVFLPLQERADIVNRNSADLFICIHTNSSDNRSAKGVETFILGTEKMDKNLDVAMRENAVIKLESDYKTTYQGFDPNSIDSYIMFELMQNSYMDQSLQYATFVQRQFVEQLHRSERGVRQAAFWVLLKSACPSILLEMGFISNAEEEKYLSSKAAQTEMAQALVNAFAQFTHRTPQGMVEGAKTATPEGVDTIPSLNADTIAATAVDTIPVIPVDSVDNQVVQTKEKKRYWAVQFYATKTPLKNSDPILRGIEYQAIISPDGWVRYVAGWSEDKAKAQEQMQVIKKRFPDCWLKEVEL